MQTYKLGISRDRRVVGAILNLVGYVGGVVAILTSDSSPHNPAHPLFSPLTNQQTGCVLLLMAVCMTPYILYPCCLDNFPKWLRRHYGDEHMSHIARGIYGVGGPIVVRPKKWVAPVWVRGLCLVMLALILLGNLAVITFSVAHQGGAPVHAILALLWILALVALFFLLRLWRAMISPKRES